jgi:cytochrome c biogenesis protein CcmG/thiol:disulfide interchange protein DsbE
MTSPATPSRTRVRGVVVLGAAVLVVAALVLGRGALSGSAAGASFPLEGKPAPAVSGSTLAGDTVSREHWRGGVTVVNIWASWCGPCRQELPIIAAFARHAAGSRVRVLTIDTRDGPAAARSLLDEVGAKDLPVVQDPAGRLAVAWGVTGVPETFVVDHRGVIRALARGGVTRDWLEEQVSRWGPA